MLRKAALLLALALLFALPASAQDSEELDEAEAGEAEEPARADSAQGLTGYGFKWGGTTPEFRDGSGAAFDELEGGDPFTTLALGVFAEFRPIPYDPPLWVQPELLFTTKGAGIALAGEGAGEADLTADLALYYLQAPLLLKGPLEVAGVEGELFGGPYLAYAVSRRLDTDVEEPVSELMAGRLDALRERWDYGFTMGVEFDVTLLNATLTYEVRYDHGWARLGSDPLNARTGAFTFMMVTDFMNLGE